MASLQEVSSRFKEGRGTYVVYDVLFFIDVSGVYHPIDIHTNVFVAGLILHADTLRDDIPRGLWLIRQ